jgi:DNA-binding MarR family transcriptional regulator
VLTDSIVLASPSSSAPALDLPDGGVLGAIVRLNMVVSDALENIAGEFDLSFADYLVLGVVRRSPESQGAPTEIDRVLGRTTGGVTLALDRLETRGLLRRTRHAQDGRRVIIELTAPGRRVATAVNDALHEWEASVDLPMSAARAVRVLDDLTAALAR